MNNFLSNLSKRDKNALIICAAFLIVFLVAKFIFFPAINKRNNLKRIIQINKTNLAEMIELQHQYNASGKSLEGNKKRIQKRGKQFSLFSYIDSIVQKCGVKKNVAYMKPSFQNLDNKAFKKAYVKLKIESISLQECIDFFNKVENFENMVRINSFSISTTGKGNEMIDAVIETETIMLTN